MDNYNNSESICWLCSTLIIKIIYHLLYFSHSVILPAKKLVKDIWETNFLSNILECWKSFEQNVMWVTAYSRICLDYSTHSKGTWCLKMLAECLSICQIPLIENKGQKFQLQWLVECNLGDSSNINFRSFVIEVFHKQCFCLKIWFV